VEEDGMRSLGIHQWEPKKLLFFVTNLTMQLSYIWFPFLTLVAAASVAFSFVRPLTPTPTLP
jgi:hypothetical protein